MTKNTASGLKYKTCYSFDLYSGILFYPCLVFIKIQQGLHLKLLNHFNLCFRVHFYTSLLFPHSLLSLHCKSVCHFSIYYCILFYPSLMFPSSALHLLYNFPFLMDTPVSSSTSVLCKSVYLLNSNYRPHFCSSILFPKILQDLHLKLKMILSCTFLPESIVSEQSFEPTQEIIINPLF